MQRLIASVLLVLCGLCLGLPDAVAAGGKRSQVRKLDEAQVVFASAVRWGEFEQAWQLVDPQTRVGQPLTELQLERFRQIRVTGYREGGNAAMPDGSITRPVEIGVVNRHTQAERTVRWREQWRWDDQAKRWWASELPDFWSGE